MNDHIITAAITTPASMDQRMQALFTDWHARSFAWGTVDCCQLAADAVQRLHGITPPAVGAYSTLHGALRVVQTAGGYRGLLQAAGLVPVPVQTARRGDVAIVDVPVGDGCAVFGGSLAVVTGVQAHTTGAHGLVAVRRCHWAEVWGVRNA